MDQFSKATMLVDSYGVALVSAETCRTLTLLHCARGVVLAHDLLDLFGEPQPVTPDRANAAIKVDKVKECIATAPPPPHLITQGWMENGTPKGNRE